MDVKLAFLGTCVGKPNLATSREPKWLSWAGKFVDAGANEARQSAQRTKPVLRSPRKVEAQDLVAGGKPSPSVLTTSILLIWAVHRARWAYHIVAVWALDGKLFRFPCHIHASHQLSPQLIVGHS